MKGPGGRQPQPRADIGTRHVSPTDGKVNPAMWAGRKRDIIFHVGHGGGSFYWYVAVPAYEERFYLLRPAAP